MKPKQPVKKRTGHPCLVTMLAISGVNDLESHVRLVVYDGPSIVFQCVPGRCADQFRLDYLTLHRPRVECHGPAEYTLTYVEEGETRWLSNGFPRERYE
jgi:hypothetical protein